MIDTKYIRVADGRRLSDGKGGTVALALATDDDWRTCCLESWMALSMGAGAVEDGQTWEQAIAKRAAWMGLGRRALGRTTDEAAWAAQLQRWESIVREVASRPSAHREQMFVTVDGRTLTLAEAHEAGLRRDQLRTESRMTGLVLTSRGWMPLADVPRSG